MSEQRIAEILHEFRKGWVNARAGQELAAAYENLTTDRDSWRRVAERLQSEKSADLSASPAETGRASETSGDVKQHPIWLLTVRLDSALERIEASDEHEDARAFANAARWLTAEIRGILNKASETSGWRTFWGVIGPRGMPCLFGPHRDDVGVIDDDERIALFQVKEIAAPPHSASSATTRPRTNRDVFREKHSGDGHGITTSGKGNDFDQCVCGASFLAGVSLSGKP